MVVNLPMPFASFCEETKREEAVRKDSGTLASNPDVAHRTRWVKFEEEWCR